MERFDQHIEQLLLHKSYSQLTAEELAQVAPIFDQASYQNHRQVLLGASELFGATPPPLSPQLEHQLLAAFDRQYPQAKQPSLFERLASHQMPTWLALGIGLSLSLLFTFLFRIPEDQPIISEPEVIYQTDTVYIEVPIAIPAPTLPESTSVPSREKENNVVKESEVSRPVATNIQEVNPSLETPDVVESNSMKKDADLLDLVVRVY